MQYAIIANRTDIADLRVMTETARNLVALYDARMSVDVTSIVQIPMEAYMRAIGSV